MKTLIDKLKIRSARDALRLLLLVALYSGFGLFVFCLFAYTEMTFNCLAFISGAAVLLICVVSISLLCVLILSGISKWILDL